jgi:hypothetical protein
LLSAFLLIIDIFFIEALYSDGVKITL